MYGFIMKVCIIGMGLIGGSLGLSLKKHNKKIFVHGVVHHKKDIQKVLGKRAADQASIDPVEGALNSDWIILATPPASFEPILKKLSPHLKSSQVVTDVGSVKKPVMELYRRILKRRVPYLGSHPIAGSEKKGLDAASSNLFNDAICVLTPDRNTAPETLKRTITFWKNLRALPLVKSPQNHDKVFAYVSHLPHLISFCMVNTVSNNEYTQIAGEAWRDMTRIAQSPGELWAEISLLNRVYILESLRKFCSQLAILEKNLQKSDLNSLKLYLNRVKKHLKHESKTKHLE
jgi:prephenate dehydrogenase